MRRSKHWVVVVAGLMACTSAHVTDSEPDVDAGRDAAPALPPSDGKDAGAEAPAPEPPASVPGPDAPASSFPGEAGCVYLSQHFPAGVSFRDNDGCNTCQCFFGQTSCSLVGCLGRPTHCDLPFDPGSCDESHPYYWHNPATGLCELGHYTGCGGNLNRFNEYGECAFRCSVRGGAGQSCTYEGQTYRHRERVARKPSDMVGCGPCLCNDGNVLCPPADCACPEGKKLGLQCVSCFSDGGCASVEERCFPACDADADCDTQHGVSCDKAQGVCVGKPDCF